MALTLDKWREMEAEELRKRDVNQRKALTVSDWRKEQARQERENLRLSKLHTKLTLGEDWREREAAKRATPEYRASKAQEALAERASVNRSLLPPSAYAPLPEEGETEIDLPGGGKATFGAETLRNIRAAREVPEQQNAEGRRKVGESVNRMYAEAYEKNKQRYEQELADRGLRSPLQATSPEDRRSIEEQNSVAMMSDFRQSLDDKRKAKVAENLLVQEYRDYKRAANEARKNKDYESARIAEQKASNINEQVGGDITNISSRNRYFSNLANEKTKTELAKKAEERRAINEKRTTANPEAASPKRVDFTPKSTGAPIGVGTESITYDQEPAVGDATQQPFGVVPPKGVDRGVSFGAISQANVGEDTNIPDSAVIGAEEPRPASKPFFPQPKPFTPIPMTSTERTDEDILPGISSMPKVERQPGESISQYNKRELDAYRQNVILPSFDENVQNAYSSSIELNELEKQLYRQRFVNPKQYEEVAARVKEQHDIIKKAIDDLREESRSYPPNSREKKFKNQQIAVLKNQLGFFAKRLY
jgi:hypothetical protein